MKSYVKFVTALAIITAFLGLDRFFYEAYWPGLLPKYWWFGLMLASTPLWWSFRDRIPGFLLAPFTLWSLCYLFLLGLHWFLRTTERAIPLIETQILSYAAVLAVSFVFYCCSIDYARRVFWAAALLLIGTVGLEFIFPNSALAQSMLSETHIPGRPSGTLLNPNAAAEAALLCFLLCIPLRNSVVLRTFLPPGLLAVACVTFSRAGIVCALAFALLSLASRHYSKVWAGAFLALALTVAAFPTGLLELIEISVGDDSAVQNIATRIRSITEGQFYDTSSAERGVELEAALEAFAEHPLIGTGAAGTRLYGLGPHNQLAMLLGELGIIGGAFWFALALMIGLNRGWFTWTERGMWMTLFLVASMATHNMFENQYWILAFTYFLRPRSTQVTTEVSLRGPRHSRSATGRGLAGSRSSLEHA